MKQVILALITALMIGCDYREIGANKDNLLGNDYRLFQDTLAWDLAKAVEDDDRHKIREEVLTKGIDPNSQEPRFGNTLLMMVIRNGEYESAKALLEVGANPNLGNTYRGTSAIIYAAKSKHAKYLKLLLNYKGDPTSIETAPTKAGDNNRETALLAAISYLDDNSLEKVKLLVEAGADMNYYNEGHTRLPLSNAIMFEKMDVAFYLLKKGADYRRVMHKMSDGQEVYILEALRKAVIDLDSEQHRTKMEIVTFLKGKGLDYQKEPIPERMKKEIKEKYPNSWEEYMSRY